MRMRRMAKADAQDRERVLGVRLRYITSSALYYIFAVLGRCMSDVSSPFYAMPVSSISNIRVEPPDAGLRELAVAHLGRDIAL